jgi:hypothetical protein
MKRTLLITIDANEKTCGNRDCPPNVYCPMFDVPRIYAHMLPACLEAEKKARKA